MRGAFFLRCPFFIFRWFLIHRIKTKFAQIVKRSMIRYLNLVEGKIVDGEKNENFPWVHICPPISTADIESFASANEIPSDFITDSLDIDERSRYEREDEANYILINTPVLKADAKANEAIYVTIPIGIILKEDQIITVSQAENPVLEKFLSNRVKGFKPRDIKLFVLQIFDQNVFSFLEALKKLNLKRNLIEQELYNSSRNEELKQLLRIEKSLVYFVNSLSTNDLLMMKMKRTDFLRIREDEDYTDLFEDTIIDNSQALEMSNVYTNILSGTMEAYAAIVSNNQSMFIHRLTIITIILMVPTLVASFYGMNLNHLPLSQNKYAFYILIFVSILIGVLLIWFFKKDQKPEK